LRSEADRKVSLIYRSESGIGKNRLMRRKLKTKTDIGEKKRCAVKSVVEMVHRGLLPWDQLECGL